MANRRVRAKKFFITALNERLPDNLQFNILTLLNDDASLLINQYAKVFTLRDLGEFDIIRENNFGVISFFPNDNRPNDYTYAFSSFSFISEAPTEEFKNEFLGDLVSVGSFSTKKSGNFSKIIEIPFDFSSSKLQIQSSINDNYQYDEIIFTHNGNNTGIGSTSLSSVKYGTIFSGPLIESSLTGLGTYFSYIENDKVFIDFIPTIPITNEIDFNISLVSIANTNFSLKGDKSIRNINLSSRKTFIPQSQNPNQISTSVVGSHDLQYQASYYIAQCTDLTNNNTQISEIIVINSRTQAYLIEYGSTFTDDRIGSFSTIKTLDAELLFTPSENIDVEVVLFQMKISSFSELSNLDSINLDNFELLSGLNRSGSDGDSALNFNLTHKQSPIFERFFNGSSSSIVDLSNNTILIPKHFFITGEKVRYISDEFDENSSLNSIVIEEVNIPGIGNTDKLPAEVYVIKVDNIRIKLAKTAEDALKILPESLNFTDLGVGLIHKFISTQQNTKALISIDNVIQNPIRFTNIVSTLSEDVDTGTFSITVDNEKLFSFNDIIKINDEIMKISSIGIGSTNSIIVRRNFFGTIQQQHLAGSLVRKFKGNYSIIGNKIYFTSPPYGLSPITSGNKSLDERDYFGIQTKSSFDGRVFLRSGIPLGTDKAYSGNHIFDNLNDQFDGLKNEFILKENNEDIVGISTNNSIILLNSIYQSPKGSLFTNVPGYYELTEEFGETKINFIGQQIQNPSDINTTEVPYGGVIVSVGSTSGFGYQPLVSAGGTAIVSAAGTISQISIGNSGSGYRIGIQTQVNVGVKTYSAGIPNIELIGTAIVSSGNVISVNITNSGVGYTFSNPPEVIFDDPIGYTNIPLIYSSQSQPGIGTQATIDLVIGKGTDIISFNINNFGYGYTVGDILTISTSENVGIPTISNNNLFTEFQISVDETYNVDFSGWSMGQFQVLDSLNSKFNGKNKNFQISLEGKPISISKRKGSPIELEYVLLIFINDILQIPIKNYTFTGSIIKFNSAPRGSSTDPPFKGDTCKIIFYKGTEGIDVNFVEILDSPKIGDLLTIKSDFKRLSQKSRIIELISSIDTADTNKYSDFGISENENLLRPVTWCKQTEDLYILGKEVTKDRKIYNPYINPISYLIKNLNDTDTEIFVDSAKLFFDYSKENISSDKLDTIEIVSKTGTPIKTISFTSTIVGSSGVFEGVGGLTAIRNQSTKSLSGPDFGAKFDIERNEFGEVISIQVVNPGFSYSTNDTITILGSNVGGNDEDDDIIIKVLEIVEAYENISNIQNIEGDFGLIVGIGSTSILGIADTCLTFDLFIPQDSFLRDNELNVGISTEGISGIQTGYRFVVSGTNDGSPNLSFDNDGNVIGAGTKFLDNIYECLDFSIDSVNIIGIGVTNIVRVITQVNSYDGISGFGTFYGKYSWGKITVPFRSSPKSFEINFSATSGIGTNPIIRRKNSLKTNLYLP